MKHAEKPLLTEKRLVIAGWLAFTSALMTVPWMLLTFSFPDKTMVEVRAAEIVMLAIGVPLFVFLMLTLRQLLNSGYRFHLVDNPIKLLMLINVLSSIFGIVGLIMPVMEASLAALGAVTVLTGGGCSDLSGGSAVTTPDRSERTPQAILLAEHSDRRVRRIAHSSPGWYGDQCNRRRHARHHILPGSVSGRRTG